ncbi:MAG: response regulator transcription factor [Campylobacteraceae bacterium]
MMERWQERLKELSVLYVEDEENTRKSIAHTLSYFVKSVFEASDGKEATEIFYTKNPDIILTDICMPNMNGVKLVKNIRTNNKKVPIVVLTAHTEKKYLLELVDLKIEKFLLKPITLDSLLEGLQICAKSINSERFLFVEYDKYKFDFSNQIVMDEDKTVTITNKEATFLSLIIRKKGHIVPYQEIESVVWNDNSMSSAALRTLVKNLRKKFDKDFIKNHSQSGYSFSLQ